MANTPRKMQDPTEAALSAIQDALNLRETPPSAPAARIEPPPVETEPARDTRRRRGDAQAVDEDLFFETPPIAANEPGFEEPQLPRRAANDDRRSAGQVAQALQRRPAVRPYLVAGVFSAVWAVLGIATAIGYFGADVT